MDKLSKATSLKNFDKISKKINLEKSKNLYFVEMKSIMEYNHNDFLNSVIDWQQAKMK